MTILQGLDLVGGCLFRFSSFLSYPNGYFIICCSSAFDLPCYPSAHSFYVPRAEHKKPPRRTASALLFSSRKGEVGVLKIEIKIETFQPRVILQLIGEEASRLSKVTSN